MDLRDQATPGAPAQSDSPATGNHPARAAAPDLARGFMLLLIAIANVSIYLWGHEYSPTSMHPVPEGPVDQVLVTLVILFVDGRIYPMFAFLFGYGMVQFSRSRIARGIPERVVDRMLRRRHAWLIVFGGIHAALLFAGDILGAYGLAGLILAAIFFRRSDRALTITAWVFAVILAGFTLLSMFGTLAASLLIGSMGAEGATDGSAGGAGTTGGAAASDPFATDSRFGADLFSGQEDYGLSILIRLGMWVGSTIGAVLALAVVLCLLCGWIAARRGWLEAPASHVRSLHLVAACGIPVAVLGAAPQALVHLGVVEVDPIMGVGFTGISTVTGIAGGIGYAALFGLLAVRLRGRIPAALRPVAGVGRRSLSFYLLQSLVFAPLLAAWGFGLGAEIGSSIAFAIAAGVWVLSLVLAALLDTRGARGPAENLLRRLTYRGDDPVAPGPEASATPPTRRS